LALDTTVQFVLSPIDESGPFLFFTHQDYARAVAFGHGCFWLCVLVFPLLGAQRVVRRATKE
jgi:hypothetical protein